MGKVRVSIVADGTCDRCGRKLHEVTDGRSAMFWSDSVSDVAGGAVMEAGWRVFYAQDGSARLLCDRCTAEYEALSARNERELAEFIMSDARDGVR